MRFCCRRYYNTQVYSTIGGLKSVLPIDRVGCCCWRCSNIASKHRIQEVLAGCESVVENSSPSWKASGSLLSLPVLAWCKSLIWCSCYAPSFSLLFWHWKCWARPDDCLLCPFRKVCSESELINVPKYCYWCNGLSWCDSGLQYLTRYLWRPHLSCHNHRWWEIWCDMGFPQIHRVLLIWEFAWCTLLGPSWSEFLWGIIGFGISASPILILAVLWLGDKFWNTQCLSHPACHQHRWPEYWHPCRTIIASLFVDISPPAFGLLPSWSGRSAQPWFIIQLIRLLLILRAPCQSWASTLVSLESVQQQAMSLS